MRLYKLMVAAVSIAAVILAAYFAFPLLPGTGPLKPIAERLRSYVLPLPGSGGKTPPSSGVDQNAPGGPSGRPGAQDCPGGNAGGTDMSPGKAGNTSNGDTDPDKYYMTFNEVNALEHAGTRDKLLFLSIAARLGRADTDRILAIAADGVTYEEMREIRSILEKKLNADEIKKIEDILSEFRKLYSGGKLVKK